MKKFNLKNLILLPAAIALVGAAVEAKADTTSRYELNVNDFTQLVVDGVNVDYKSSNDSAGIAVFYADKNAASQIIFENNNKGKLKIQTSFQDQDTATTSLPVITVYSRFLKDVTNNSDSTVRVLAPRPTMELKASTIGNGRIVLRDIESSKFSGSIKTGNGTIVVTGSCESAVLSNTGTGSIQADELKAQNVSARFFGTGTTGCWATDVLTVKGVMAGKLYYRDKPAKIRNYSAGVKIYSLEGTEWTGNTTDNDGNDNSKE
jgi:hypothetical protein